MVFFFFKGWVSSSLKPKLIAMFILGGLQGLLGWYMVKSGLVNNPNVSQYRLTAHLGLALFVYAYILWMGMSLLFQNNEGLDHESNMDILKPYALFLSIFVFVTTLSGGFVAGLKAGHAYNTFPLMNGQLIPDGLFTLEPGWINFFENVTTVQFDHRLLATVLFISIIIFYIAAVSKNPPARVKLALNLMLAMLFIQVSLGISTLLFHVPAALAASHQGGALLLFTIVLFVAHQIRRACFFHP
jgi:cytochrome c oxidase assembly protein subunit 15